MEKQRQTSCGRVSRQVEQMRKLYSQIGEPLPADVIIDLHRHLGPVLDALQAEKSQEKKKPGFIKHRH